MADQNVWVADDRRHDVRSASEILATRYLTESFTDVEAMLRRLAEGSRPELVVLPDVEACRSMRAGFQQGPPILVLTAPEADAFERAIAAGATDQLTWPCSDVQLLTRASLIIRADSSRTSPVIHALLAILRDDLRAPLDVVALTSSTLLGRKKLDASDTTLVEALRAMGVRGTELLADLSDIADARLGEGLRIVRRHTNAHTIATRVVKELQTHFAHRDIRHEATGNGLGRWDAESLTKMLTHLASNAVQYSDDREVWLRSKGHPEGIVFEVHNTGTPISSELLPRLFEPVRRTNRAQGTRSVGLGLTLVKHIVDSHRGTIQVRSTPDAGTTVSVWLPHHDSPAVANRPN